MKAAKKHPTFSPTTVAILGTDSIASDTLGLLLQEAGYETRVLVEPKAYSIRDDLGELLVGVHLLILAPPRDVARRKACSEDAMSAQAMAKIPVLELITAATSSQRPEARPLGYPVGWPCRIEDLKREIEAALLAGPLSNDPNNFG